MYIARLEIVLVVLCSYREFDNGNMQMAEGRGLLQVCTNSPHLVSQTKMP